MGSKVLSVACVQLPLLISAVCIVHVCVVHSICCAAAGLHVVTQFLFIVVLFVTGDIRFVKGMNAIGLGHLAHHFSKIFDGKVCENDRGACGQSTANVIAETFLKRCKAVLNTSSTDKDKLEQSFGLAFSVEDLKNELRLLKLSTTGDYIFI